MTFNNILLIFFGVLFNAFAQLALKAGANKIGYISFDSKFSHVLISTFNFPILFGLLFYTISVVIWIVALSRVPVSLAYPMLSLGYIFVSIFAYFFFNEPMTLNKTFAMIIIIFGIYLLTQK
jgi:multidrug transporter EmrE-like cation transporter